MVERESVSDPHLRIVKSLASSILGALLQSNRQVISWKDFIKLEATFKVGNESYGLNLTQVSSEVINFLRQLVDAAVSKKEGNQKQWDDFLEKTKKFTDDFFDQPLGKFGDLNVRPITLSQLNAVLRELISKGVTFNFNGQQEKNE